MSELDKYLDCGCASPGSVNGPGRHFCGKPNSGSDRRVHLPGVLGGDDSPEDHCFRSDGCDWHGSAPADGSCCCCGQPAEAHTGCDCE